MAELHEREVVSVSCESTGVLTAVSGDTNVATVDLQGENLTITGIKPGETDITISGEGDKNYNAPAPALIHVSVKYNTVTTPPLIEATPEEIKQAIRANQAPNHWAVGDLTPVPMNGPVGRLTLNEIWYAMLLDFNHNIDLESAGQPNAHFKVPYDITGVQLAFTDDMYNKALERGVQGFAMNPQYYINNVKATNAGGWEACYARKVTAEQFFNAFSSAWQAVISPCTKYTNNVAGDTGNSTDAANITATLDKVFYLGYYEVTAASASGDSNKESLFQQLYTAYANGMSKVHFKNVEAVESNYGVWTWLRSPANKDDFINLYPSYNNEYGWIMGIEGCTYSYGAAPAYQVA